MNSSVGWSVFCRFYWRNFGGRRASEFVNIVNIENVCLSARCLQRRCSLHTWV